MHPVFERPVHAFLRGFQAADIFGFFGFKGVEEGFIASRRVDAARDIVLFNEPVEAEAGGNNADGTDDRGFLRVDFLACAGDPVPARRRDVLDERIDGNILLARQIEDLRGDKRALGGRAPPAN